MTVRQVVEKMCGEVIDAPIYISNFYHPTVFTLHFQVIR